MAPARLMRGSTSPRIERRRRFDDAPSRHRRFRRGRRRAARRRAPAAPSCVIARRRTRPTPRRRRHQPAYDSRRPTGSGLSGVAHATTAARAAPPPRAPTSPCTRPPTRAAPVDHAPHADRVHCCRAAFLAFDQYAGLAARLPADAAEQHAPAWIKASDVARVDSRSSTRSRSRSPSTSSRCCTTARSSSTAPAAIGTDENPTPTGIFYYTDPLDLANAARHRLRRVRDRTVGPQQHAQRVRRRRRPDRHPRHQRPRHHRASGVARLRPGATTTSS